MVGIKELPYYLRSYAYKHKKMSAEALFSELQHKLDSKEPFVAGKIGGFELMAMRVNEFCYTNMQESVYDKLCNNAGFFPEKNADKEIAKNLRRYSQKMKDTLAEVDYLIRWQYPKEEYFIRKYCTEDLKDIEWLGVVCNGMPLGNILRGRKILVVSPFSESITKQYKRRELVYAEQYLPEFELLVYKAVQTIAGNRDQRFNSWFDALDGMISDISKMDFDLALVGAGAYSLPLCAGIKKSGKSAIHMGGEVQILFGIMGKRWEDNSFVKSVKNEYWIYPEKSDVPQNYSNVEGGCYW